MGDVATPSAEALLVAQHEAHASSERALRVRAEIARAPAAHREVLEAVYVRGEAIHAVVDRELAARGLAPTGAARRRARATIDKRLERARRWLRVRMD
jgi:DNA-directed RNA polymerase specialized sigma24 family protein